MDAYRLVCIVCLFSFSDTKTTTDVVIQGTTPPISSTTTTISSTTKTAAKLTTRNTSKTATITSAASAKRTQDKSTPLTGWAMSSTYAATKITFTNTNKTNTVSSARTVTTTGTVSVPLTSTKKATPIINTNVAGMIPNNHDNSLSTQEPSTIFSHVKVTTSSKPPYSTPPSSGTAQAATSDDSKSYDRELVIIFGVMLGLMFVVIVIFGIHKCRQRNKMSDNLPMAISDKFRNGGGDVSISASSF